MAALTARIDAVHAHGVQAPPLVAVPRTGLLPLSFAQQRLWVIDQLEPGNAAYNMPTALRLRGPLDVAALEKSFAALVERHESLRTTFGLHDGQPIQVIHPPPRFPLPVVDLGALPADERDAEARRQTLLETQRPFDLARGPLFRAVLLRMDAQDHLLIGTMHHIVSDGWSMGVLVRELATFYAAHATGQQARLPALPVQYADFAAWQRSWLRGEALERQLGYWRQQLSGAPPVLELPTDKPVPSVQSSRGAWVPVQLPRELTERLLALCQHEGTTPFMALLAVWQVLLSRYSGQDDISVGSPIAGRTRAETEGVIGFFVNTLVFRTRVDPRATFRELLARVRATTLGAYEHQDAPFEKLVEALQPRRSLSHSPLFQVMLVLQNSPSASMEVAGGAGSTSPLKLNAVDIDLPGTKSDLTLSLEQTPEGLSGTLGYRTDLFERPTVSRMVKHLATLLEAAVSSPETLVGELALLRDTERHQVLEAFNASPTSFAVDGPLHALIEEQASRHPSKPAVACEGQVLTYGELDTRANQLAWHLRSLGVGPDTCVALCLERSVETVVALLGIWKAGGAYVPLDPSQPALRLLALVGEVAAPVVVTESRHAASFAASAVQQVLMDTEAGRLASARKDAPPREVSAGNLAYVLFTSGTTGRPKGVAVPHAQLVHYVRAATERLGLADCASFALVSTFVADLGNTVLFPALCTGGLLHVLTQERAGSPAGVAEYFQRHPVDCVKLVPSHLSALLTAADPRHVLPRKKLVLGGESSTWALMDTVRELAPDCEVFNHYGPTETTVGVLAGPVETPAPGSAPVAVPLGRPLAHTRLYVLDEALRPVPVGVPGELYIGGAQVTRGYLHRPELTAERYLPDLYAPVPGARMYRSGDRVRWREDGRVEFIGRADFQVKVRGFRVEPGEVATVLREHPEVRDAVVLAREDVPGDKRLVAYVVPALEVSGLRAWMRERLPEYMVPSALVPLEALPLTANGKVDRKALPVPEAPASGASYVAPRTPTEVALATIWAALLRVEKVGVEEDFFALGGHSLLATQVVARVRKTFRVELPMRALFEAPTIAALAARIDSVRASDEAGGGLAIAPVPRDGALPLSFAQQRLWFIDQLEPGSAAYNMPTFVRMEGPLDVTALQHGLSELVRRHEALRTTFTWQDGQPVQVIAPHVEVPLKQVDLSGMQPQAARAELERLLREELLRPFDLVTGPLVRSRLLKLGSAEHVFVLNLHHIVSDGWSMGVLVQEVVALYEAFSRGRPSPLVPLPIQYADYAVWQRQWLQGAVLDAQLGYWKQQLAGASTLELPTDKPRPPVQTLRGARVSVGLSRPVSDALRALCQQEGATPFMALLAAFQVLLSRYSGQEDISVGTPIAGRNRSELEGLIGFFVNTLVLRVRVSPSASFLHLLRQARESALGAYAHQDVPFERLVEELQPTRDLSRGPLFQVMFALQNAPRASAGSHGLKLRPVELENTTLKFDLELTLGETAEGIQGTLGYNIGLFEPATAERMAEHFRMLVEALVARPEAPLSAASLLTEAERRQVLVEWNATASEYPRGSTLPEVFSQVVARYADRVAVEFGEEKLTYRQLDARANRLAWQLRGIGVSTDSRVAIALDRSLELIVSLVAILKAGGAYVPLDPAYPLERLSAMVEDARPAVLITSRALLAKLPTGGLSTVVLEDVSLEGQPTSAPPAAALPQSLAYIDFTSGSTGRPKGVGTPQAAVLRTLFGVDYAHFGPDETFLLIAPVSFDASTLELWGPLLHGARLVVFPPHSPSDVLELESVLVKHGVTTLHLTSGLFTQVVDHHLSGLRSVRQLLTGGDVVSAPHVRRVLEELRIPVTACYGPTEATLFTSCHRMTDAAWPGTSVPIGRPIGNTYVYVLDAAGQPVPPGLMGELFIGGDGLARGYVEQPALTAERFVPDAFSGVPGARLYRTGDLARWRKDGVLEFLGRADAQVKLRGYRIELAEVEAALRAHADVGEALALVREDVPGDKRLVAYVVPSAKADEAASVETVQLRAFLAERLPEYMVPSAIVVLTALPLTANAKVDRKALPAPEAPVAAHAYVAPRTPMEQTLAALWAEVLRLERVGVTDNFFALGGHSLLAVRLMARLREHTGLTPPLSALFQAPTVEGLAKWAEQRKAGAVSTPNLVPLAAGTSTRRPLFLVHGGGGSALAYTELARQLGGDRPIHGLSASGIDGGELPAASVEALARDYLAQVRAVQPRGPYLLGGWSFGGLVAYEMARLLQAAGERVEALAIIDSPAPTGQPHPEPDTLTRLAGFGRVLGLSWQALPLDVEHLRRLDVRSALASVLEQARRAPSGAPVLDLDVAERLLGVHERLHDAQRHYVPGGTYTGPTWLFKAATALEGHALPADLGWGPWLTEPPQVHEVPGDHYALMRAPHVRALAQTLAGLLADLERDGT
ncbi:amino acid adenylation domain-containing protein [Pyxidicoccus sp. MSG2]|uniref:amino acid adenylation domain-containing protein n=1 Tax=Pyxidicoccus sp. MSG2 TaxID=2996790 RepID=UPI002270C8A3|nr:non-ribosomal peptide synthetase [Pyxidicoccus sp. MSG2]MCY1015596.1 amino acid adenylation domain-containing protein [Pyxidicoccus sp. MSG2]